MPARNTINLIVGELQKLNETEQKELLAQLRAKRLFRKKIKPIANPQKGIKLLSITQIDKIKHITRKKR
ncbi:MAG: hypothetical protein NTW29_11230 [Bacteroidetes bacterium]|nr:hypothetical protein [Bacteroidota bacterium]